MTSPHPLSKKLLLVADDRPVPAVGDTPGVRRYRLARLRFAGRSTDPRTRYEHLKSVYD